jgi:CubicO group peptidase (beta-lactamase class C family)
MSFTCKSAAILLFVLVQLLCCASTAQTKVTSEDKAIEQLNAFIQKKAGENNFSGVVLVAKSGKPVLSAAVGLANRKANTPHDGYKV